MDQLKYTDWSKSQIYIHFKKNGRWKHDNDEIYSE